MSAGARHTAKMPRRWDAAWSTVVAAVTVLALLPLGLGASSADGRREAGLRSLPWRVVASSPASDRVTVEFSLTRFDAFERVEVAEEADSVTVAVLARGAYPAGGWMASATPERREIVLARPLGRRALLHAPTPDFPAARAS
jgi:hypothetical protein